MYMVGKCYLVFDVRDHISQTCLDVQLHKRFSAGRCLDSFKSIHNPAFRGLFIDFQNVIKN